MNRSAKLVLINGTNYDFKRIYCWSYRFHTFKFPELVSASTCEVCDLKWSDSACVTTLDDHADVIYELNGTNHQFTIQARIHTGFDIYVQYSQLSNLGDNLIKLEWLDDTRGYIQFYLSGRLDRFISTGSFRGTNCWMFENLDILGKCTLKNLCITGTHDSGMSTVDWRSTFATQDNCKTQQLNIYEQLLCGVRYFDIRAVISNGNFFSGHYALVGKFTYSKKIFSNYQGAIGQSIDSIIEQINSFVACNNELIILSFSHGLNLDLGDAYSNRPLNQQEYDNLFNKLLSINYRFIIPSKELINLTEKTLDYFIGNKRSAVCIVLNDLDDLAIKLNPIFLHNGFYRSDEFPVYDRYSNTNDLEYMIKDQLDKMKKHNNRSKSIFLLSWTLTQHSVLQQAGFGLSIYSMAIIANSHLFRILSTKTGYSFKKFAKKTFPNVIYLDYVTPDCTAICLAINLFNNKQKESLINKSKESIVTSLKNGIDFISNHYVILISFALNLFIYIYLYQ